MEGSAADWSSFSDTRTGGPNVISVPAAPEGASDPAAKATTSNARGTALANFPMISRLSDVGGYRRHKQCKRRESRRFGGK